MPVLDEELKARFEKAWQLEIKVTLAASSRVANFFAAQNIFQLFKQTRADE